MNKRLVITYLSIMAGLCSFAVGRLMGADNLGLAGATSFILTFFVYTVNAATDKSEDFYTRFYALTKKVSSTLYDSRADSPIYLVVAGALMGFLLLFMAAEGKLNWQVPVIAVIGLAYSIGRYRLKNIPGVKNVVVAGVWAFAIFTIPAIMSDAVITKSVGLYVLQGCLFVSTMVNTILCDIRDIEADRYAGIKTIANTLDVRLTFWILQALSTGWLILIAFMGLIHVISDPAYFAAIIPPLWPFIAIMINNYRGKEPVIDFLVDLDLVVFFICAFCLFYC